MVRTNAEAQHMRHHNADKADPASNGDSRAGSCRYGNDSDVFDALHLNAEMTGCSFFDAGSVAKTSPLDDIHLDAENTRAIGRGIAPVVRKMLEL